MRACTCVYVYDLFGRSVITFLIWHVTLYVVPMTIHTTIGSYPILYKLQELFTPYELVLALLVT